MNAEQKQKVCKAFLRTQRGYAFDAIQAARALWNEWGIELDWHEMSYALDYLERVDEAERARCRRVGGMTVYAIK